MKITIIGTAHPYRGGLASYNECLAKALLDAGHEVTIETFILQYPGFLFPGKTQFTTDPAPKNITIRRTVNSINPFNWIKIGRKIKNDKPDLLMCNYWLPFMAPCFGTISKIARKNKHTLCIPIVHNIIPHERRTGDTPLSKYFVKHTDAFVVMAESVKNDLHLFTKTKPVALNPHPLYDNFGEAIDKISAKKYLKLEENYKYILFFGFIRDYKGLDILLKAMPAICKKHPELRLIIAGEYYSDAAPYKKLIASLNLHNQVIERTDFIPNEEVRYYFCASDLVVQPYKDATQSGVTQIAYHFNKPMVVTNVGGLPEMVPHLKTGYVTAPEHEAIAAAVIDYFNKNDEQYFIQNIAEIKKQYSWQTMVKTIENMYEKIKTS